MRHIRDDTNELKKIERLQGLKAIRETWRIFGDSDHEYVDNLERRIRQVELRIMNGL